MALYKLGDIAVMKKIHPCGSDRWEIIRVGADIKIKCCTCQRVVLLERIKFEKAAKKYITKEETAE